MKLRLRLYDHEAEYLNLKVKSSEEGRSQARYYLTQDQCDILTAYRLNDSKAQFVETIIKRDKKGNVIKD